MIFIVHGEDYSKSRKLIVNQQKKLNVETKKEFDVTEIEPNELGDAVFSFDMFGEAPFVILNISKAANKNLDAYLNIAKKTPKDASLIILSNKKLTKSNIFIKNAVKIKAKEIVNNKDITGNIFKFVDYLFYKNRIAAYKELNKLTQEENDPFYTFSMILYGLRNVLHAKYETKEFSKKSPFVKEKAQRQAEKFSKEQITNLYNQLYETDKKLKTGQMSSDIVLTHTIEKIINS